MSGSTTEKRVAFQSLPHYLSVDRVQLCSITIISTSMTIVFLGVFLFLVLFVVFSHYNLIVQL